MTQRYRLVTDADSHWYVIPANKLTDWNEWSEITETNPDDERGWDAPAYASPIGGSPTLVSFENPQRG